MPFGAMNGGFHPGKARVRFDPLTHDLQARLRIGLGNSRGCAWCGGIGSGVVASQAWLVVWDGRGRFRIGTARAARG
jgi:hypothetical protein